MELTTQDILNCLNQGTRFALVTIITSKGSTPRTSGSKMMVLDGQLHGTIGGGLVEAKVIETCLTMMSSPQCKIEKFILNQDLADGLDMVCGGDLTVLIETFGPDPSPDIIQVFTAMTAQENAGKKAVLVSRIQGFSGASFTTQKCLVLPDGTTIGPNIVPKPLFDAIGDNQFSGTAPMIQNHNLEEFIIEPSQTKDTIYIFGAGHVGLQLAKMAHLTDFRTIVVDDRAEFANEKRFEHAHAVHVADLFSTELDKLIHKKLSIDKNASIVILTRGHLHDQAVLEQALKTKAAYIGMIGSRRKRDQIYANLIKKGVTQTALDQVYSPIGLEINSETPAEIAVSIMGEIIQIRAQNQ